MKAQNLTISVPADKCDKNCPYCISKITWQTEPNLGLMIRNARKVKRLAQIAGVTSVLITSKKEPFMNIKDLFRFINEFSENHWLEIQTNGIYFNKHYKELTKDLYRIGVNVLAFSVDRIAQISALSEAFKTLSNFGIVIRICVNVNKNISDYFDFNEIMKCIVQVGNVSQVLFRNINYPRNANPCSQEVMWIDNNVSEDGYKNLYNEMIKINLDPIRTIPQTGITTYNYQDISICFSDYCIQESNEHENIRSLIFQDDGHVYTSWNYKSSILF